MLPKKRKIADRSRITQVLKKGFRLRMPLLQCHILRNQLAHHRFCVIVSKKVSATAVGRNRMRRQLYAALHEAAALPPAPKTCYDVAAVASPLMKKASYKALKDSAAACIKKLSHE